MEERQRAAAERAAQEEAARQADDAAYAAAEQVDTAGEYGDYLEAYPAGRHAAEARERQTSRREQEIARRKRLQQKWPVGRKFRDALLSGGQGPEMIVIPGGTFQMGCVSDHRNCQGNNDDELPSHKVTIGEPFAVGKYEVTFGEWDKCVQDGGCRVDRAADNGKMCEKYPVLQRTWVACNGYSSGQSEWRRGRPVGSVSWKDAQAYVKWLSGQTRANYRLLSESEWEYAARAGSKTEYSWGNEIGRNLANCYGCGSPWSSESIIEYPKDPSGYSTLDTLTQTAPVGSYAPNLFGLHDIHGNV